MSGNNIVAFTVQGQPVPKQSFRYREGGGYTDPRVKRWQSEVGWAARSAYLGDPVACDLFVKLTFRLPNKRRMDADNLSKGTLDSCNGILWEDDKQIVHLEIKKRVDSTNPGVDVEVCKYEPEED